MHFRSIIFLLTAVVFSGCSEQERDVSQTDSLPPAPVLNIPGTILMPSETGMSEFVEEAHQKVLLYCWIPMGQYAESEADLLFLASLNNRGITAVPVQFTSEVRNAAQNQMNTLGIPVAVAVGDDSLKQFMRLDILPAAVLVQNSGETVFQTGFGCAERAVRSLN